MRISLQSKSGTQSFDCTGDEPLLYAGLRQGVSLPYECATGTCGTCRARLASGETDLAWTAAPGLSKIKRDKGDILLCQTRARSDCDIKVAAHIPAPSSCEDAPRYARGEIRKIRRLTHDVMDFELTLSAPLRFKPGQFVTVEAKELPGRRAYSMVNAGPQADTITLVVKRKPGGGFSDWLFGRDVKGAELDIFGPLGQATFRPEEQKHLICIAGGSGIAGIMSILEHATSVRYFDKHKGHVFFGVRGPADAFYTEELSQFVERANGGLEVTLAYSHAEAADDKHGTFPAVQLASGFVHDVASKAMAGRFSEAIGYIAGPPPMVDGAIRMLISQGGLSPSEIRYDKFA